MRDIKFRGKRPGNGEWAIGDLLHTISCLGTITDARIVDEYTADENENADCRTYEVDPATVGQYTGLKDKNGVEIYEGDIVVAWSEGLRGIFVVTWRQEAVPCWLLYPAWQGARFWKLHGQKSHDGTYHDNVEIIGNVHDNPELLKEDA